MKTDAIRRCIDAAPKIGDAGDGYSVDPDVATIQLAAIEAENAAMREAISGALRIETLWVPREVPSEHAEEARAVHAMRQAFLDAILATPLDTTNHCPICEEAAKRIEELEADEARIRADERERCATAIRASCAACQGTGIMEPEITEFVTHDMALDCGEPQMEGQVFYHRDAVECEYCGRPIDAIRALADPDETQEAVTRMEVDDATTA